jgi:hypothetical protein
MIQVKKKRKRKKIKSDDEKKYESNTKVNMYFKQSFLTGYKFFYILLLFPSAQLRFFIITTEKNEVPGGFETEKIERPPPQKHFRQNWKKIHRFENNNRTTGHSRNMYVLLPRKKSTPPLARIASSRVKGLAPRAVTSSLQLLRHKKRRRPFNPSVRNPVPE